MIHVFVGTKAQYVKIAPLLRRMDAERIDYRLIDSGQHAVLARTFREELGVRAPDRLLGRGRDIESIPEALRWTLSLVVLASSRARLRNRVFGERGGVCVVHGDTPTTLLSALMAKRAGLAVAHVEAGLRTHRWLHPFPEEIIRVLVGRLADVLFAPGPEAASNLRAAGVKGRIVEQSANTVLESVRDALDGGVGFRSAPSGATPAGTDGSDDDPGGAARPGRGAAPIVVTMHRVENLHRRSRRAALVDVVESLAATNPVCWVMHGPTERALAGEARRRLSAAGVDAMPLTSHLEFLAMLAAAPFVITDGGSIQEECALLGTPTLVWRDRTDRPDGVGENVVLARYDPLIVRDFLRDPQRHRRPCRVAEFSPSAQILAELREWR